MKRVVMICCCMLAVLMCFGQRKEISKAKTLLKSTKESDFQQAERLMTDLLAKDTANRSNIKIYATWYDAVTKQYEAANEKLYLRQKYDTTAFFSLVRRMYDVGQALDSLDARPDKKGRVRPGYRKSHAEFLDKLRSNLWYGGTYQLRKSHYEEAYGFFEAYIGSDRQPLFTGYDYLHTDSLLPQVAYWATYSAYRQHRADSVLRYHMLALQDTIHREFTLQYICEAYQQKGDHTSYVSTLKQGFEDYPEHHYFFPRLADYYTSVGCYDSVLVVADKGLACYPNNQLFLLARSVAQLNLKRYDECLQTSERLLALNDSMPEPYFNMSTVYLNRALELEQRNEPRKFKKQLTQLYQQALPYIETYRKLAPDDKRRWAPALYRVYLNLNKGKQFDEIDRILRNRE